MKLNILIPKEWPPFIKFILDATNFFCWNSYLIYVRFWFCNWTGRFTKFVHIKFLLVTTASCSDVVITDWMKYKAIVIFKISSEVRNLYSVKIILDITNPPIKGIATKNWITNFNQFRREVWFFYIQEKKTNIFWIWVWLYLFNLFVKKRFMRLRAISPVQVQVNKLWWTWKQNYKYIIQPYILWDKVMCSPWEIVHLLLSNKR